MRLLLQPKKARVSDLSTLPEISPGFAFDGRPVHFDIGRNDFHLDLIFFHDEELRYFVIELKNGKLQPDYADKLNFDTSLIDDRLPRQSHTDTVGILICGSKYEHTVRYSLGRSTSPMAGASHTYDTLPTEVRNELSDADRLTAALDRAEELKRWGQRSRSPTGSAVLQLRNIGAMM